MIEIALNLYFALGSMKILTILMLPFHKAEISFRVFVCSISFNSVLYFSIYMSFTSLDKFIHRYFFLFDVFVNGIVFLNSLIVHC